VPRLNAIAMAAVEVDRVHGWSLHKGPGGACYFAQAHAQTTLMRMSPSGGIAKPPKASLSAPHEPPPPPVNGRTSFGRAGSGGHLSAIGACHEAVAYVGPFGHVGMDPDADPAAATVDHGPHVERH